MERLMWYVIPGALALWPVFVYVGAATDRVVRNVPNKELLYFLGVATVLAGFLAHQAYRLLVEPLYMRLAPVALAIVERDRKRNDKDGRPLCWQQRLGDCLAEYLLAFVRRPFDAELPRWLKAFARWQLHLHRHEPLERWAKLQMRAAQFLHAAGAAWFGAMIAILPAFLLWYPVGHKDPEWVLPVAFSLALFLYVKWRVTTHWVDRRAVLIFTESKALFETDIRKDNCACCRPPKPSEKGNAAHARGNKSAEASDMSQDRGEPSPGQASPG